MVDLHRANEHDDWDDWLQKLYSDALGGGSGLRALSTRSIYAVRGTQQTLCLCCVCKRVYVKEFMDFIEFNDETKAMKMK